MRYATAGAFRTALEARLAANSESTGLSLVRLRKSVVFSRLLARLLATASHRWVLKGGLAMDYRFGTRVRTTKDMDLGRSDDEEAAIEDLLAAQTLDLGDYFTFEIERTGQLDELDGASAVRFHVRCRLAGRVFEDVVIDVGFDLNDSWEPDITTGPDLLGFADIDPVNAPTLPLELHVAEKLHAYTRTYGPSQAPSSRAKDLVDLVLICREARIDAGRLTEALTLTFDRRGTHRRPTTLPDPPPDWATPYGVLAGEVDVARSLEDAHRAVSRMLDPVLIGTTTAGMWDPVGGTWRDAD